MRPREPESAGTRRAWQGEVVVLLALEMVVLGLATFIAMLGFIALCDRV
jgi:hypothetical protein